MNEKPAAVTADTFVRRDPEVERFLKVQPIMVVPRHQLAPTPPPGMIAHQLLGHRVIRYGD